MSDFDLPHLPSDDELGITDEDRENYEDEEPEINDGELAALLGEDPGGAEDTASAPARTTVEEEPGGRTPSLRPPVGEGPRSRWRGPATVLALLAIAWASGSNRAVPRAIPANAPDTVFSSARAMGRLVEIARRPHPPGSAEHARVRSYIMGRLRELGLDPRVQTATTVLRRETTYRAATVRNIVARMPGTASTGAIVLMAHYDGRGVSTAAADDGSGVVTILETLRALRAGPPLRNDVIVLITDAEELGLMGAKAFVEHHPWMADVSLAINVEMRGGGGPSIMFETGGLNGWVVDALEAADPAPFANSLSYEIYKRLPNDTDFTPFRKAGVQGLNFAAVGRAHVYHQAYDTPGNLSEGTLQHHGIQVLAMTRYLGDQDLADVNGPDKVYFRLPWVGLVTYEAGRVLPLGAVVGVIALLVLLLVRRRVGRWSGVLVGLGLSVVTVALTAGAGSWSFGWLARFHPEFGALQGSAFHSEGWYVLALAAAAFTVTVTLFGIARRWYAWVELCWGALALPVGAAMALSFFMPLAAMNLQWPVLASLVALAGVALWPGGRMGTPAWVLSVVFAAGVLVFLVPVTELAWLALSFRAAMQLGALLGVVFLLLLPALGRLREPNAWWAPLAGSVLSAAFLGLGIRAATPSADRPSPSVLLYAYDRGAPEGAWVTGPVNGPEGKHARAWAVTQSRAAFSSDLSLQPFGYRKATMPAAPGPPLDVPPLDVGFVSETVADGTRHVRMTLRSALGAEVLAFIFPDSGTERLVAVNGVPLSGGIERPTYLEHWGTPDSAVILDLALAPDEPVRMSIVEQLIQPNLLGPDVWNRPPDLAPDVTMRSDRVLIRTVLGGKALVSPDTTRVEPDPMRPASDTTGAMRDTTPSAPDTSRARS